MFPGSGTHWVPGLCLRPRPGSWPGRSPGPTVHPSTQSCSPGGPAAHLPTFRTSPSSKSHTLTSFTLYLGIGQCIQVRECLPANAQQGPGPPRPQRKPLGVLPGEVGACGSQTRSRFRRGTGDRTGTASSGVGFPSPTVTPKPEAQGHRVYLKEFPISMLTKALAGGKSASHRQWASVPAGRESGARPRAPPSEAGGRRVIALLRWTSVVFLLGQEHLYFLQLGGSFVG